MRILQKTFFALIVGAMVMALAAPTSTYAQQQNVEQANFGNLIAALNNVNAQVRALERVDVQDVQVVNIEDIKNNLNQNKINTLNNALQDADIDAVQTAISDNQTIVDALNQNNVAVSDVVAIDVLSGGDVVVYFQPSA